MASQILHFSPPCGAKRAGPGTSDNRKSSAYSNNKLFCHSVMDRTPALGSIQPVGISNEKPIVSRQYAESFRTKLPVPIKPTAGPCALAANQPLLENPPTKLKAAAHGTSWECLQPSNSGRLTDRLEPTANLSFDQLSGRHQSLRNTDVDYYTTAPLPPVSINSGAETDAKDTKAPQSYDSSTPRAVSSSRSAPSKDLSVSRMYSAKLSMGSRRNGCTPNRSLVLGSRGQDRIIDIGSTRIPRFEITEIETNVTTDDDTVIATDRVRDAVISESGEDGKFQMTPGVAASSGGNNEKFSTQKHRDTDNDDDSFLRWIANTIDEPVSRREGANFIEDPKSTSEVSKGPTVRYSRGASQILMGDDNHTP